MKLRTIRSLRGPVTLFVTSLVLVVILLVLWNVVLAVDYQHMRQLTVEAEETGATFHWTFIALGSCLIAAIIALLSVLGAQLIGEIRFAQRLSSFVATFTHELNSPLASIKLFAQTLQRPDLPATDRERFLSLILSDVERLRGQISNVLRAGQVDQGVGLPLTPEDLDLRAFLEEYLAARRLTIDVSHPEARLALEPGPTGRVRVDRGVFRQALDNLLDNSLKYARNNAPQVTLRLEALPDGLALEISDDGVGIAPDELDQVFGRFERGRSNPQAQRRPGTGLGLWIVQAIVEAHGGHVEARSPGLGAGATIRVELPTPTDRAPEPLGAPGERDPASASVAP